MLLTLLLLACEEPLPPQAQWPPAPMPRKERTAAMVALGARAEAIAAAFTPRSPRVARWSPRGSPAR